GAGFIGSHVAGRLLSVGHAVTVFDDLNPFYDPAIKRRTLDDLRAQGGELHFVQGDLADAPAVERLFSGTQFDQVIHLAARAG
ncbi:MAG TPA: epimerase, partial [Verrucomicrobiales bacterium]|nr:epimerase [Verrucomicrobiales bacterium]